MGVRVCALTGRKNARRRRRFNHTRNNARDRTRHTTLTPTQRDTDKDLALDARGGGGDAGGLEEAVEALLLHCPPGRLQVGV